MDCFYCRRHYFVIAPFRILRKPLIHPVVLLTLQKAIHFFCPCHFFRHSALVRYRQQCTAFAPTISAIKHTSLMQCRTSRVTSDSCTIGSYHCADKCAPEGNAQKAYCGKPSRLTPSNWPTTLSFESQVQTPSQQIKQSAMR